MLQITTRLSIPFAEIEMFAIRSQGAGGQNVNKVASAIHLRFDIGASSLPDRIKSRLLGLHDQRITGEGVVVIKAQEFRSQDQNREAALERLRRLVRRAAITGKVRRPTRPHMAAHRKRLDHKTKHGRLKALRRRVASE
ncbi:MAG: aminoacyl-tRNA hydrolase [Desulfatitalea sp.]|nr:aminoacyl-tRNA hydrolase [Desulfatitalea sp.]NNK02621.1 aminoacyl-tRNA hydrolase [Desulfatitalea sp.]